MTVKFIVTDPGLREFGLPTFATSGSAGVDLRAMISDPWVAIQPGECLAVSSGVRVWIEDPGLAGYVLPRSGLGTKGLVLANLVGLIDCVTANMDIETKSGNMNILDVLKTPDTKVKTFNEQTREYEFKEIREAWHVGKKECIRIKFDDGTHLECTTSQLIMTEHGWKSAMNLRINDEIM